MLKECKSRKTSGTVKSLLSFKRNSFKFVQKDKSGKTLIWLCPKDIFVRFLREEIPVTFSIILCERTSPRV
jgi:hypothetical protein